MEAMKRDRGPVRKLRPVPAIVTVIITVITLAAVTAGGLLRRGLSQEGDRTDRSGEEARDPKKELQELRRLQRPSPVDRAVDSGLAFLKSQQRGDGSFGFEQHYRVALTSLSVMAFLSRGHLPGDTPDGRVVSKGLGFLLEEGRQNDEGYFGNDGRAGSLKSGMYGHGIAALLLAELLGMGVDGAQEEKILLACRRALDLSLKAQSVRKSKGHEGGWRYTVNSPVSDLSITVWHTMALRAAKNAGMDVPSTAIDAAVGFIGNCFHEPTGGFSYQPAREPTVSSVSAGLLALHVCGVHSGEKVRDATDYVVRRPPSWEDPWCYYAVYYYSQAMHQAGEAHDQRARKVIHDLLLARQTRIGSWPSPPNSGQEERAGAVYFTAMAILALSVEYRLLPIYQR